MKCISYVNSCTPVLVLPKGGEESLYLSRPVTARGMKTGSVKKGIREWHSVSRGMGGGRIGGWPLRDGRRRRLLRSGGRLTSWTRELSATSSGRILLHFTPSPFILLPICHLSPPAPPSPTPAMSPDLPHSPPDAPSLSATVKSDGLQVRRLSEGRRFTAPYLPIRRNLPPTSLSKKYA